MRRRRRSTTDGRNSSRGMRQMMSYQPRQGICIGWLLDGPGHARGPCGALGCGVLRSFAARRTAVPYPFDAHIPRPRRDCHDLRALSKPRERGSALAPTTVCPIDVSSWLCLPMVSNSCRACCVHNSASCVGSLVRATSRAKSNNAFVFVFAISSIFRLKSRTPSADAEKLSCAACAVCSVVACPLFQVSRAVVWALSAILLLAQTGSCNLLRVLRNRNAYCQRHLSALVPRGHLLSLSPYAASEAMQAGCELAAHSKFPHEKDQPPRTAV
jgi:hypothetical protein